MSPYILCNKKKFVFFVLLVFCTHFVRAEDWVLAAQAFDFTQNVGHSSTDVSISSLVPQLILEQFSTGAVRITSEDEMLMRKLKSLQTDRLSLYLQLSKEVKTRDALLLVKTNDKDLKKSLKESEIKIAELQKKIDDNLECVEKAKLETESKKNGTYSNSQELSFFDYLKSLFIKKESIVGETTFENIRLYKDSSSELFSPSDFVRESGYTSYEYETSVLNEKINGLITGLITVLGDYMAVTAEFRLYPGGDIIATVTDVGSMSDIVEIAKNISYGLIPNVLNTDSVEILFDILPAVPVSDMRILVDGVVYSEKIISIYSGIHTIEIDCDGYELQTITYDFSQDKRYYIHVPLRETVESTVSLRLKRALTGSLYANGIFWGEYDEENRDLEVTVNGKPVIGQLFVYDENTDDKLTSYYYIPTKVQVDGSALTVNLTPTDLTPEIDKRRIWMYRGYSALMVSLPFYFYSLGTYNNLAGYFNRSTSTVQKQIRGEAETWRTITYVTEGISITAGVFFVYELFRYLYTASKTLPKKAKVVKDSNLNVEDNIDEFFVTEDSVAEEVEGD